MKKIINKFTCLIVIFTMLLSLNTVYASENTLTNDTSNATALTTEIGPYLSTGWTHAELDYYYLHYTDGSKSTKITSSVETDNNFD